MEILILIFLIRESKITRMLNFTLGKEQRGLDVRKYSFSQITITILNKVSIDCVHASNVKG